MTPWESRQNDSRGPPMCDSIDHLFTDLDRFDEPAVADGDPGLAGGIASDRGGPVVLPRLQSRPVRPQPVHDGPAYQALLLCWRNGQRSPIHNHRGSNCGVKVLRGVATETVFGRAPNGMVVADRSRDLPPGHICASADDDIHQMSNLQAGGRRPGHAARVLAAALADGDVLARDARPSSEWDDPINDRVRPRRGHLSRRSGLQPDTPVGPMSG